VPANVGRNFVDLQAAALGALVVTELLARSKHHLAYPQAAGEPPAADAATGSRAHSGLIGA
jgi:hypothetical protein